MVCASKDGSLSIYDKCNKCLARRCVTSVVLVVLFFLLPFSSSNPNNHPSGCITNIDVYTSPILSSSLLPASSSIQPCGYASYLIATSAMDSDADRGATKAAAGVGGAGEGADGGT